MWETISRAENVLWQRKGDEYRVVARGKFFEFEGPKASLLSVEKFKAEVKENYGWL